MVSILVYLIARFALWLCRALPRWFVEATLKSLAGLAYYLDAHHRHIAHVNLKIAFPNATTKWRSEIARKSFQNVALNLLEIARLPLLSPVKISSLVQYDPLEGLNNHEKALARGKPVLYLTGHFSAWELLPTAHALYGYPLSFITRPLDNVRLERYLLRVREAAGNQVIPKKNSARLILEKLRSCGRIGILMDQNTDPQEGTFAEFFGLPASTTTGLALFALRSEATVLPGFLTAKHDGKYAIKFLAPVELTRTGDMARDIQLNTERFNRVLEDIIRLQPETWLWGHMRWKYQPPGNPENLYRLAENALDKFLEETRKNSRSAVPAGFPSQK